VTAAVLLAPVPGGRGTGRGPRDRLELLTALTGGPGFDPLLRGDILQFPATTPVWWWGCRVPGCARSRQGSRTLCMGHQHQWQEDRGTVASRAEWIGRAMPLPLTLSAAPPGCLACPDRPAVMAASRQLCARHWGRLKVARAGAGPGLDFTAWLGGEVPYPGYGDCRVMACARLAWSPLGLCHRHESVYQGQGRPGAARLPGRWFDRSSGRGVPFPSSTRTRPRSPAGAATRSLSRSRAR
jgi:hypothetical protein